MLPFRKILFPVDYSDPCKAIVPYVSEMQQRFSTELSLVHAYGAEALAYSSLPIADLQLPEQVRSISEERLREFARINFPGLKVDVFIEVGEPGAVIENVVRHQGTDLVMLPTHGLSPLRRFLLGSVTAKVLHDLTVPVWTGHHPLRVPYTSILAAIDTSDEAEAVIRAAASLAASYQAKLSLAYVLEMPPINMESAFGTHRDDFMKAADDRIVELKKRAGVSAPHKILDGLVADSIHGEAVHTSADLIVTGRGVVYGAVSRIWSHLYPIIRHAPCPVLSI
jgi:nucleotide-binding universal stress UspA family protein